MTFKNATALTAGLVGAMALGVWVGPYLTAHAGTMNETPVVHVTPPVAPGSEAINTAPTPSPRMPTERRDVTPSTANLIPTIPASAPQLHKRLKPLLNAGADMAIVSNGFRNAEDFAATVHASKNTNVPFMVLKHHVVDEGKSLKTAIHDAKPEANASLEADLARAEARSDLASLN